MKYTKSKIAKPLLVDLDKIDKKKDAKKITQKMHDSLSKKTVMKWLNKLK